MPLLTAKYTQKQKPVHGKNYWKYEQISNEQGTMGIALAGNLGVMTKGEKSLIIKRGQCFK
jgi:hypothetical protein